MLTLNSPSRLVVLSALVWAVSACGIHASENEASSPEALATDAIEKQRDEKHKSDVKIIWPEKDANDAKPLLEQMPESAEIYLIRGYISYECVRLRWVKGAVSAERVAMGRTWFYNAKGESFISERVPILPPRPLPTRGLRSSASKLQQRSYLNPIRLTSY